MISKSDSCAGTVAKPNTLNQLALFASGVMAGVIMSLIIVTTMTNTPSPLLFLDSPLDSGSSSSSHLRQLWTSRSSRDLSTSGRQIFIDLGANNGKSVSFFMGDEKVGERSHQGGKKGSSIHALGATGQWEIVAFEPLVRYKPLLEDLKQKYSNNPRVTDFKLYTETAIFDSDGQTTFHMDNAAGDAGSSLMKNSKSVKNTNIAVKVNTVDIVTLLMDTLRVKIEDTVILKVDIEGYEFDLMRRILSRGLLPYIDILAVEYHDNNKAVLKGQKQYAVQHKCIDWVVSENNAVVTEVWD